MAVVARSAKADFETVSTSMWADHLGGDLVAGAAIDAVAPCYIKESDGKVYMSDGTAANEAARVIGFSAAAYAAGQEVSLWGNGARAKYSDGLLTAGKPYYLMSTAGRLSDVATTGGLVPIAIAYNINEIVIVNLPTGDTYGPTT